MTTQTYTDDLSLLLGILPRPLQDALADIPGETLLEVVLDVGRPPQARLTDGAIALARTPVFHEELAEVVRTVGEFGTDNRAGIEGTLHRISAIRNRRGTIVGLTLRVGRAVFGTIDLIRDLIENNRSVLLLGRPGVGKTTKLREIARVLADDFNKRVIVIDTSNEIAGDGDVPHRAIGSARRMQVPRPEHQHAVMIEAVENHMPEVIIVDEIGTAAEAMAARTIAERGVQLIGTAHGNTLENIVCNPTLSELVGGVQTVTLGDEEARLRRTQKTIRERKGPPAFDAVVEIVDHEHLTVHADTAVAVDRLLRDQDMAGIQRSSDGDVPVVALENGNAPIQFEAAPFSARQVKGPVYIYPYAVSRDALERVIRGLRIEAIVTNKPTRAHLIISLRARSEDSRLAHIARATGLPVHTVKKNTTAQLRRLLQNVFNITHGIDDNEVNSAVREMEEAIQRALAEGVAVPLPPRRASLRRVQHRLASRHRVVAESAGSEPKRHLIVRPHASATLRDESAY